MLNRLFNTDMERRLRDLQTALEQGAEVSFTRLPAIRSNGASAAQPERVVGRFGDRAVVFALPMARMVAAQLEANGFPSTAERLREMAAE